MDGTALFQKLLDDGNLIMRAPFPVSSVVADGLARREAGTLIPKDREFLLDPANWDESIILLLNPKTGERNMVVTRDQAIISRAQKQYESQFEPVGTLIRVYCNAQGSLAAEPPEYHLDRFVESLRGFHGWEFKAGSTPGHFQAVCRLNTTDAGSADSAVSGFQHVLDCLAAVLGIGLNVLHVSASPIRRKYPTISFGKLEQVLEPVSAEEKSKAEAYFANESKLVVAKGMNRAFCEVSLQARFTALWSTCEHVFDCDWERLLTSGEIKMIVAGLRSVATITADASRLARVRKAVTAALGSLGKRTKNERMAEQIASLLGIDVAKAFGWLRRCSSVRGTFTHSLNEEEIAEVSICEAFLSRALSQVLERGP